MLKRNRLSAHATDIDGNYIEDALLDSAEIISYTTQCPAGLFGVAQVFIPHNKHITPRLRGGDTLTIYDGAAAVYEGEVIDVELNRKGRSGSDVTCVGKWGQMLERYGIHRLWADDRIDTKTWQVDTTANGAELGDDDRDNRIRITPKGVAWATDDYYRLEYFAPTGESVGRVEYNYDFQEAAQAWELITAEYPATVIQSATSSGSGSTGANTSTTPSRIVFQLQSKAAQTPTEDGTYYAEISDLMIFAGRSHGSATLGNVSAYEIALDIVQELNSYLSANLHGLDSTLTYALEPFITNGWESFASILQRACGFGDSSQNTIYYGLLPSWETTDGKPALFIETVDLTDYDYETSIKLGADAVRRSYGEIVNWVVVEYTDENNATKRVTPDDDSSLTDATSEADYGKRLPPGGALKIGNATEAMAINYGARYLAKYKDPVLSVTRPLEVRSLQLKGGGEIPARQIRAGKRLLLPDVLDEAGQPLIMLIAGTTYNADSDTCRVSFGTPDSLGILLAQMQAGYTGAGASLRFGPTNNLTNNN